MSFQMKPMVLSVAATFGGVAALAGLPIPAAAQQSLDRVEITGSNIRRTDTETVAPVEVITREQIQRTGKPTVAEVLRSIPSNTGGSFRSVVTSCIGGAPRPREIQNPATTVSTRESAMTAMVARDRENPCPRPARRPSPEAP